MRLGFGRVAARWAVPNTVAFRYGGAILSQASMKILRRAVPDARLGTVARAPRGRRFFGRSRSCVAPPAPASEVGRGSRSRPGRGRALAAPGRPRDAKGSRATTSCGPLGAGRNVRFFRWLQGRAAALSRIPSGALPAPRGAGRRLPKGRPTGLQGAGRARAAAPAERQQLATTERFFIYSCLPGLSRPRSTPRANRLKSRETLRLPLSG